MIASIGDPGCRTAAAWQTGSRSQAPSAMTLAKVPSHWRRRAAACAASSSSPLVSTCAAISPVVASTPWCSLSQRWRNRPCLAAHHSPWPSSLSPVLPRTRWTGPPPGFARCGRTLPLAAKPNGTRAAGSTRVRWPPWISVAAPWRAAARRGAYHPPSLVSSIQNVRSPRRRSPASSVRQFVTRQRARGMRWRR